MDLYEVIDHVAALLRKRGRLAYRALKMQFQLDEEQLAAHDSLMARLDRLGPTKKIA